MKYLNLLLGFIPLAILAEIFHWPPTVVFFASALGIVPLAGLLGKGTEELALQVGPRLGGLLNATLGNAAELIISLFAIRAGLVELVKASITGSIIGNILLVLGLSLLLGGLKNGVQSFNRAEAGMSATMMTLSVIALAIPAVFRHAIEATRHAAVEYLSLGVAGVMIGIYLLSLIYSLFSKTVIPVTPATEERPTWRVSTAVVVLIVATAFIAWLSEILVAAVEPVIGSLGVTEFFLGIVIIPLVGNVAEHLVGVQTAVKNKMTLSLAISLGSSMQVALFVGPLLVFVSLAMGNPMTLIFNPFELAALAASAAIAALISLDGESNWLEGAQLLAVYVIVALAFFFLPIKP